MYRYQRVDTVISEASANISFEDSPRAPRSRRHAGIHLYVRTYADPALTRDTIDRPYYPYTYDASVIVVACIPLGETMNLTINITTPLLVIGAALPRTATTSIAAALEQLGYHVFHATTYSNAMFPIWNDICEADEKDGNSSEAYKAAFDRFVQQLSVEGFNATLDQPSCFVYEQLMEYYPDAKVLQTLRAPESWAKSMVEMSHSLDLYYWQPPFYRSWNVTKGPFGYWSKKQLGYTDEEIHPRGVPFNSTRNNHLERKSSVSLASCEAAYQRYENKVENTVPADKLVQFHPKQGWKPLCDNFLPPGKTCPTTDFPHVNSRNDSFLLDWRRMASAKVHLYKIHPVLSKQEWLVKSIVFIMKQRRAAVSLFQRLVRKSKA